MYLVRIPEGLKGEETTKDKREISMIL